MCGGEIFLIVLLFAYATSTSILGFMEVYK